jgi:hypothetical protein
MSSVSTQLPNALLNQLCDTLCVPSQLVGWRGTARGGAVRWSADFRVLGEPGDGLAWRFSIRSWRRSGVRITWL